VVFLYDMPAHHVGGGMSGREEKAFMKSEFVSLKKNSDFSLVYKDGKSIANRLFVIIVRQSAEGSTNRVGISVSKKIGNSVVRHRLKRQVRECFRTHWQQWKSGHDIIVIARKGSNEQQYQVISGSLLQLMKKHGLERGLEKE
jgi:ribonuclease P protein component